MNRVVWLIMIVNVCLLGFLGSRLFETASTIHGNHQSLREGNEQIYGEIAKATNLILFNTDLMMRFSHYQNNHNPEVKQVMLCPECSSPNRVEQKIDPAWTDLPEDEETVYQLEDAVFDNKEIFTQIQRLTSSLSNQYHKLNYTLLKMRHGDDADVFSIDPPLHPPKQINERIQNETYLQFRALRRTVQEEIEDRDGPEALKDFYDAIETNIRPELHGKLAPLVAAIRYAENGGAGREYGVLHPNVEPTYRSQAGWCAATVQKNWDRYKQQEGDTENFHEYIAFLGSRYCPIDDPRDTMGLNKHWVNNVSKFYKSYFE